MQRQDVGTRDKIVERGNELGRQHPLCRFGQALAVVIGDVEPECPRTVRNRLADPAHADDTQNLSTQLAAEHGRRSPAAPVSVPDEGDAFAHAPGHADDEGHRQVRRIVGKDARRIGDDDVALARCLQIDVVRAGAIIRDQLQPVARICNELGVDRVGNGRDQHVATLNQIAQFVA